MSVVPFLTRPKRAVSRVFLHCSASGHAHHNDVSVMREWHLARGWDDVGYHLFIRTEGRVQFGRDLERVPVAQAGHNTGTIAICLHGLVASDFTAAQFESLRALATQIDLLYSGTVTFHGHCEVANKSCPVFDYRAVLGLDRAGRLGNGVNPKTATAARPVKNSNTLRIGSSGPRVAELQRALAITADGIFGPQTERAVRAFQWRSDLLADGIVGPKTWEALQNRGSQ